MRKGSDSAHSGAGVNGVREEYCVRDVTRVDVTDVTFGDTGKTNHAGYSVVATLLCGNAPSAGTLEAQAAQVRVQNWRCEFCAFHIPQSTPNAFEDVSKHELSCAARPRVVSPV